MILRGAKTLAVRMKQQNANSLACANFLATPHPFLPNHPQHELAKRQMRVKIKNFLKNQKFKKNFKKFQKVKKLTFLGLQWYVHILD